MTLNNMMENYLGAHSWFSINRFRTSLVSKAITGFSMSVFLLSSFPKIVDLTNSDWRLTLILVGSALFLCGYIYAEFVVPKEINSTCSIEDAVRSIWVVKHRELVDSRVMLLEKLYLRLTQKLPKSVSKGNLIYAKSSIDTYRNAGASVSEDDEKKLLHADFMLRQYDLERTRMICVAMLGGGVLLLSIPTIYSFILLLLSK